MLIVNISLLTTDRKQTVLIQAFKLTLLIVKLRKVIGGRLLKNGTRMQMIFIKHKSFYALTAFRLSVIDVPQQKSLEYETGIFVTPP